MGWVSVSVGNLNWIEGSDRQQTHLLPVALEDYVGTDNPVCFLDAFVAALDLRAAGFRFPKADPPTNPPICSELLALRLLPVTALQPPAGNRVPLQSGSPCIFLFVLLGNGVSRRQAGVVRPVATGRMTAWRENEPVQHTSQDVMRARARSTSAHCSKLEPLLEHDNLKIIVARILQV